MKNELGGKIMAKFVRASAKICSYLKETRNSFKK